MATARITEHGDPPTYSTGAVKRVIGKALTSQKITTASSVASLSSAFGTGTTLVSVLSSAASVALFGSSTVAAADTAGNFHLVIPANTPVEYPVIAGQYVSIREI